MCGLAGFVGLDRASEHYEDDLRVMLDAIRHRGADDFAYCLDDNGAVGLARLAIIDLALGKQPMSFADERYWLVLNGTIVNFLEIRAELAGKGIRFQTSSDTEVLGQALLSWGPTALKRLSGGYAFAFYDRLQRRLLLGRDSTGERPMFYSRVGGGLAFSSEVKGIFALPGVKRQLSPLGLRQTFKVWSPIDPTTCFSGVHSLPPGHYGIFEGGNLTTIPYFRLPPDPNARHSFSEAKQQLHEHLARSVRIRLRSDFGVGVLLSGGVDSAVIAAVVREELGEPPHTFSYTLPGSRLDESEAQLRLVRYLGTRHSSIEITRELTRSLFPATVYYAETPLFRPSVVAVGLLANHVNEQGCRVALFGQGSDELLGGYDVAKEAAFLARYQTFRSDTERRQWLVGLFHDAVLTKSFSPDALISFYRDLGARQSRLGAHYRRFAAEPDLPELTRPEVQTPGDWSDVVCDALVGLDPDLLQRPPVERSRAIDMLTICGGWGMNAFADRVTLRAGVEVRAPFLDPELIRFGWCLPEEFTLGEGRREKHVLREAFAGMLPKTVLDRPKQAMRALGADALHPAGADDWVQDVVARALSGDSEIIDPRKASTLVASLPEAGSAIRHPINHSYCLMLSTLLLEEQFIRNFPAPVRAPAADLVKVVDKRAVATR